MTKKQMRKKGENRNKWNSETTFTNTNTTLTTEHIVSDTSECLWNALRVKSENDEQQHQQQ